MGERCVPWVSGRAGPDAPSRLRAWRTPRSDRRRPAVGRVARGCAPHDWRLGRPAGRCNREWEVPLGACKLPVGFPVGPRKVPLGARVGLSKRASKSEWERRGGPRRVPLGPPTGRRTTTVRALLPLGYLPSPNKIQNCVKVCERCSGLTLRAHQRSATCDGPLPNSAPCRPSGLWERGESSAGFTCVNSYTLSVAALSLRSSVRISRN